MIKLLIFDLDGTLFDTAPGLCRAVNRLMVSRGMQPIEPDLIKSFIGHGLSHLFKNLVKTRGPEFQKQMGAGDKVIEDFRSHYKTTFLDDITLFAGATDFLRKTPLKIAIVSNKLDYFVHELVARSEIAKLDWTHIAGGNTHVRPKPFSVPIHAAISRAGVKPSEALMIGDGLPDIEGALAAGVKSVAVEFGYTPIEDLVSAGAHATLSHYDRLSDVIQIFD